MSTADESGDIGATDVSTAEDVGLSIAETACEDWTHSIAPVNADVIEYTARGMDSALITTDAYCSIEPVERSGNVPDGTDFTVVSIRVHNLKYQSYSDLGEGVPDLSGTGDSNDWESHLYNEYNEPDRGSRACWGDDDATACKADVGTDGRIWSYAFKADYQDAQLDVEMLYLSTDESESMSQTSKEWALDAWAAIAETGMAALEQ